MFLLFASAQHLGLELQKKVKLPLQLDQQQLPPLLQHAQQLQRPQQSKLALQLLLTLLTA